MEGIEKEDQTKFFITRTQLKEIYDLLKDNNLPYAECDVISETQVLFDDKDYEIIIKNLKQNISSLKGVLQLSKNSVSRYQSKVRNYENKFKYLRRRIDEIIEHPTGKVPHEIKT